MRNIDSSNWMEGSELVEIKAVNLDKRRLNEFQLYFKMKRPNADESKKKTDVAPGSPAKKS
jgi:hypothetical protein